MRDQFGGDGLGPEGDLDRAYSRREFLQFSGYDYVHPGNHTSDHETPVGKSSEQQKRQIVKSPEDLKECCGQAPAATAYPFGEYTKSVVFFAGKAGLERGFSEHLQKIAAAFPIE